MYALRDKLSGKLMCIDAEVKKHWYEESTEAELTVQLLLIPQTQFSKIVFVTCDKTTAYTLAKYKKTDNIKVLGGYDVEVVKLKQKRPKHDKLSTSS